MITCWPKKKKVLVFPSQKRKKKVLVVDVYSRFHFIVQIRYITNLYLYSMPHYSKLCLGTIVQTLSNPKNKMLILKKGRWWMK